MKLLFRSYGKQVQHSKLPDYLNTGSILEGRPDELSQRWGLSSKRSAFFFSSLYRSFGESEG